MIRLWWPRLRWFLAKRYDCDRCDWRGRTRTAYLTHGVHCALYRDGDCVNGPER